MRRAAVWQRRSNSNIIIVRNSIEHIYWVLSCLWIVFTNSVFQVPLQKLVRQVEMLGIGCPGVIVLIQNESVPWEGMPEVFKCSFREIGWHLISRTGYLNTSSITSHGTDSFCIKLITLGHPIPNISTHQTIFWEGTWKIVCENNP